MVGNLESTSLSQMKMKKEKEKERLVNCALKCCALSLFFFFFELGALSPICFTNQRNIYFKNEMVKSHAFLSRHRV